LTADAKVTDAEVKSYYETHSVDFTTPQTRVVSHILVKDKALADKLYAQLQKGASFAALAKKYSTDPGSKSQGGQLTITRGQTVAPFDRVAFELRTGQLSKPVHTRYGWHIIHADKPATPHKSTPFAQVKSSIKQQLLQQKQNTKLQAWIKTVDKEYEGKISYAAGLAPAATTTTPTTTG
jgi:parvulin-like peptidyl-prolyl isomerase